MCEERLKRIEERMHILAGIIFATNNWEVVLQHMLNGDTPRECKEIICREFELDEFQGQAIVDMRFRALSRSERNRLQKEYDEIMEECNYLKAEMEKEVDL